MIFHLKSNGKAAVFKHIPVYYPNNVGGSTVEAQSNLGVEVSQKLRDYLLSGALRGSVNLPDLTAAPLRAAARLVHLHHDRPGVMSGVNAVLAAITPETVAVHLQWGNH